MSLPTCDLTDLPRLMCACPDHINGFTMTDGERALVQNPPPHATGSPQIDATPRPLNSGPQKPARRTAANLAQPSRPWAIPEPVRDVKTGNTCRVTECARAAGDAFACPSCLADLDRCLGDVGALIADLEIQELGQSRLSNTQATSKGTGLTFDERAKDAKDVFWSAVVTGARIIAENRGLDVPADPVAFLMANLASVGLDPAGPDIVAEVTGCHAHAMRVIDTPPARTYLGLCDFCQSAMHAKRDDHEHQCHTCGAEWIVSDRLEQLQLRTHSYLAPVSRLVDLAAWAGLPVSRHTINGYIRRGRLTRRAVWQGEDRYSIGDLLGLLEARKAG